MSPFKAPQIKTGSPVTLIQLIISLVLLVAGAVGLYVKSEVRAQHNEDRIDAIEKKMNKNEDNAQIRRVTRDSEIKDLDIRVDKNTEDITILKLIKKDK